MDSVLSKESVESLSNAVLKLVHQHSGIKIQQGDPSFMKDLKNVMLTIYSREIARKSTMNDQAKIIRYNSTVINDLVNLVLGKIQNQMSRSSGDSVNRTQHHASQFGQNRMSTKIDDLEPDARVYSDPGTNTSIDPFFQQQESDTMRSNTSMQFARSKSPDPDSLFHSDDTTTQSNDNLVHSSEVTVYIDTGVTDNLKISVTAGHTEYTYTMSSGVDNIFNVSLCDIEIDNSDYNVNEFSDSFELNGVTIKVCVGRYSIYELVDTIQSIIDSQVNNGINTEDDRIHISVNILTDKISICKGTNISTLSCISENDLQNKPDRKKGGLFTSIEKAQKTLEVNFDVDNSIYSLLGFEKRIYSSQTEYTGCDKHRILTNDKYLIFDCVCKGIDSRGSDYLVKFTQKIILNVLYNETKFHKVDNVNVSIPMRDFTMNSVSFILKKPNGITFNPRGRSVSFGIKVMYTTSD